MTSEITEQLKEQLEKREEREQWPKGVSPEATLAQQQMDGSVSARLNRQQIDGCPRCPTCGHLLGIVLLAVVMLAGCGGDSDSFTCSKATRTGTYLFTHETLGGDCGDLPPMVVVLGAPTSSDCTVNFERWSDDECTLERTLTCVDSSGTSLETRGSTIQATSDGSRITGTVTYVERDANGSVLCTGTYNMTAVRQ